MGLGTVGGCQPHEPSKRTLAGEELRVLLADAGSWEHPGSGEGIGGPTLPLTGKEAGFPGEPGTVTAPACPTESHTR